MCRQTAAPAYPVPSWSGEALAWRVYAFAWLKAMLLNWWGLMTLIAAASLGVKYRPSCRRACRKDCTAHPRAYVVSLTAKGGTLRASSESADQPALSWTPKQGIGSEAVGYGLVHLRCVCMRPAGIKWGATRQVLKYEERERILRVFLSGAWTGED